jgi:hypothetical protein
VPRVELVERGIKTKGRKVLDGLDTVEFEK